MSAIRLPTIERDLAQGAAPFPLFPLGANPDAHVRRDYALQEYAKQGVDVAALALSGDPIEDIAAVRYAALTPYVEQALPHMRTGPVAMLHDPGGALSGPELYDEIERSNGHAFGALILRSCRPDRVEIALQTGSDRDRSSGVNTHGAKWGDGFFERRSMLDYGIDGQYENITYAHDNPPNFRGMQRINCAEDGEAMLVYAPNGLQTLRYEGADPYSGPYGFRAFVDPRLKAASLLAVVYSAAP